MSVEWTELSDYLGGALDAAAEAELERELFDDPGGAAAAASFLALVDGIRTLRASSGTLSGALSPPALEELRASGIGLVEVAIDPGETKVCVIGASDAICIGHLRLPSDAGARRIDVEYVDPSGAVYGRVHDVPVDREGGRVTLACERHVALLSEIGTFRLVTRSEGARRVIATYAVKNVLAPA